VVGAVGYLSYRDGQRTIEQMAYALMDQVGQSYIYYWDIQLYTMPGMSSLKSCKSQEPYTAKALGRSLIPST
jgi:hypothetical protein